jgi:hypothetical protein
MGEEAVQRSTRDDRSRDPLYNQLKMYAELFRALGWLHPTDESSLNYTFTLLGRQVVAADDDYLPIFSECVLGIVYPTRILTIKGDFNLRPFAFLLKVMSNVGGYISRDEMIIGPLNMSDRQGDSLSNAIDLIRRVRASKQKVEEGLRQLSGRRGIQINTLYNYTRWPIAVLRDCGWVARDKARLGNGTSYDVMRLTDRGKAFADRVATSHDIRLDQLEALPDAERTALSVAAHFGMLGRSGFNLGPVRPRLEAQKPAVLAARKHLQMPQEGDILYSPFQTLSPAECVRIFPPATRPTRLDPNVREDVRTLAIGRGSREHLFVSPELVKSGRRRGGQAVDRLREELSALIQRYGTVPSAATVFAEAHAGDTKAQFYPLVCHLFQVADYESDYSRYGVNYQRWDAYVKVGSVAIPIEIKSPTEEAFLSTKAVRQALENKIVLLSRGGLETRRELTSLIVGYKIPNERGDMSTLIDDIHSAYGLSIGVIDLRNLASLACGAVTNDVTISAGQLCSLRGFLSV